MNISPEFEDRIRSAERAYAHCAANGEGRKGRIIKHAIEQAYAHNNVAYLHAIQQMRHLPVTIDEFLDSKEFVGEMISLWPLVREDMKRINPDWMAGAPPVLEVLFGGATGTAKSTTATLSMLYVMYWLSCFREPQKLFGLSPYTPIVLTLQAPAFDRVTKRVLYTPMRQMFTDMPYVKRWVNYDRYKESSLLLEGRIELVPALATVQAIQGQAVISAIMDEINFMSIVEHSKQVAGPAGQGGYYDQAEVLYTTLTRRRRGRFRTTGPNPGGIYTSGSVHYSGDFMDRLMMEAINKGDRYKGLVIRRKQYEAQPAESFRPEKFRLLVGTNTYPTRILKDTEMAGVHYAENAQVELVPMDYHDDFVRDPENALRDVCGLASGSIKRFITQYHKILEAVVRGRNRSMKSWVQKQNVVLAEDGMPQIVEENLPKDRDKPRCVHIDLSKTGDKCGIAFVKVEGHVAQMSKEGSLENLPYLVVEEVLTIQPSAAAELDIAEVRKWVMLLVTYYKLNIVSWTYDGFQSTESQQIVRKAGITVEEISMDRTTDPYDNLKALFYDDRIDMIENGIVQAEIVNLEKHAAKKEQTLKRAYIDHPPRGSKDGSDAIAGACWAACKLRVVRVHTAQLGTDNSRVSRRAGKRAMIRRNVIRR